MQVKRDDVLGHLQNIGNSCVPMSVELVLKLNKLMPILDFPFQNDNSKIGNSDWVRGLKYSSDNHKVEFQREFKLEDNPRYMGKGDRGQHFFDDGHFDNLFKRIDSELAAGRFVIISLISFKEFYGPSINYGYHMEVIYNKINDDNYKTLTFHYNKPEPIFYEYNLKERVKYMEGTDILTYKWI